MDKNVRTIIGNNIRYRRRFRRLTQTTVGKHLGVTFQQIQKYESGANAIAAENLLKLMELFQCSITDFYQGAIPETPQQAEDTYLLRLMMSHFTRIRSPIIRKEVCGMVGAIADTTAPGRKDLGHP